MKAKEQKSATPLEVPPWKFGTPQNQARKYKRAMCVCVCVHLYISSK